LATVLKLKAVLSLAYYHGLRRKEICYLIWENVYLVNNRLVIADRLEVRTKTKVSRAVFLRQETADLLTRMHARESGEFVSENRDSIYWLFDEWFGRLAWIAPCMIFGKPATR